MMMMMNCYLSSPVFVLKICGCIRCRMKFVTLLLQSTILVCLLALGIETTKTYWCHGLSRKL